MKLLYLSGFIPRSASCLLTCERKRSTGDPPSETEFDDHTYNCGSVEGGNPVPLPPRDRSRSLLLVGSKPRHERKYPLIIPSSAHPPLRHHDWETGHVGLDDDQVFEDDQAKQPPSLPVQLNSPPSEQDQPKPHGCGNDKEEVEGFDERIANDFDLLDAMSEETDDEIKEPTQDLSHPAAIAPQQQTQFVESHQSSQDDQLESAVTSESCSNLFDRSSEPFDTAVLEASNKHFEASVKPYEINVHFESCMKPFETAQSFDTTVKPFDRSFKPYEASIKPFETSKSFEIPSSKSFDVPLKPFESTSKSFETMLKPYESTSKTFETPVKPYEVSTKPFEASTSTSPFDNLTRQFEPCPKFEGSKVSESTGCGIPTARVEPHSTLDDGGVEEDALSKRPSVNELAERLSNFDAEISSQLSIMTKVLQNKVSEADCLRALECTGGNVHRSIKLARLMSLVGISSRNQSADTSQNSLTKSHQTSVYNATPEQLLAALEASSWDIAAAAASYLATQPPQPLN